MPVGCIVWRSRHPTQIDEGTFGPSTVLRASFAQGRVWTDDELASAPAAVARCSLFFFASVWGMAAGPTKDERRTEKDVTGNHEFVPFLFSRAFAV